ncbi:hypothetical protein TUZN_1632 [Thermoproteus uzoniensis 768-20]|uniref:UPF0215 protein TUZN_1632 n=1 Tax=Thermoproteus uzoniensis (strain 768-20) TaxID=999630 RepID=F2L2Q1_THEU7|nr:DUF99 family protein [Thermoproteus uzoniensis]AEA13099.1 hypothetical protein TUZN_1632 [Thermoproteus uzoniensis 768-20]
MSWLQKNFRVIGIAESFRLGEGRSIYAGVLMRRDGYIEAVAYGEATLGGVDGTAAALTVVERLRRPDIHMVMLDGCIVSFYNWIDGEAIWMNTGLPTACYVFEKPEGDVEAAVKKLFPDGPSRWERISRLGRPVEFAYPDGGRLYVRSWGLPPGDAYRAALLTRRYGKRPEPLRVARLLASAMRETLRRKGLTAV